MEQAIKIAITGGESTGKTTLTNQLAQHFDGLVVREVSREYLQEKNTYDDTDILKIAALQLKVENEIASKAKKGQFVFCDTEWINIKLWLEDKQWEVPSYIIEGIENADYDLYLLLKPDIPWEWDPLRENKDKGLYFFNKFLNELQKRNKKFEVIDSIAKEREENAVGIINKFYF
jgi:nicotinamide riboside kinase